MIQVITAFGGETYHVVESDICWYRIVLLD